MHDTRTRCYVIGGELIVLKKGDEPARSGLHAGRGARARAGHRDGVPRPARRRRALRHRHHAGERRSAEGARRSVRHRSALDRRPGPGRRPNICRRSPRPRRCCTGTRGTASAPTAASRPTWSTPAGSAPARPARSSISRAPIRSSIMLAVRGDRGLLGRSGRFARHHVVVSRRLRRARRSDRGCGAARDAGRGRHQMRPREVSATRSPGRFRCR